ncbi:hypothetical protein ACJJTC_007144 [Scirpophaga incertulas]
MEGPLTCFVCRSKLEVAEGMKCKSCSKIYHHRCLKLSRSQFSKLSKSYLSNWICPDCKNVTRRHHSNVTTPVTANQVSDSYDDEEVDMSCDDVMTSPCTSAVIDIPHTSRQAMEHLGSQAVTMDNISALLDEKLNHCMATFSQKLRQELNKDMRSFIGIEIQKLKSEFTVTTDFLAAEQKDLREEIQARREMIETLQTENSRLQKDVKSLEERLIAAEKLSRSKNIEIQAVPERKNEDLLRMFKKLCEAINLPLVDAEVHACRRVAKMDPKSDRPRNILVSLASPIIRDKILSAAARFNKASKNDPLRLDINTIKPEDKDELLKWNKDDGMAMFIITSATDLKQIALIENCESALEIMTKLESIYEQKSELNKMIIHERFYQYKMESNDSIA